MPLSGLKKEMWVLVAYNNGLFPGIILDKNGTGVRVKCLEKEKSEILPLACENEDIPTLVLT